MGRRATGATGTVTTAATVRLTDEEHRAIARAATQANLSLGRYLAMAGMVAVEQGLPVTVLVPDRRLRLSNRTMGPATHLVVLDDNSIVQSIPVRLPQEITLPVGTRVALRREDRDGKPYLLVGVVEATRIRWGRWGTESWALRRP